MSIIQTKLSIILNSLNSQTLLLPEIQRDFVWTQPRIIALLDSLFRRFPIGAILVWKTTQKIYTKKAHINSKADQMQNMGELIYGYLLDGQQRLTALLKVLNQEVEIRFSLVNGNFEIENRKNRNDHLYVLLADILTDKIQITELLNDLKEYGLISEKRIEDQILKNYLEVKQLLDRNVAILQYASDSYSDATMLFIRFNSGGVRLKQSELAIAKLALSAPSLVSQEMKSFSDKWINDGFAFTIPFLARCLAVIKTGSVRFNKPEEVWDGTNKELWEYWRMTRKAVEKTISFLSGTMHWDTTSWLSSYNALIPIIYILGRNKKTQHFSEYDRKILRKWLAVVTIRRRYSGAAETKLDSDIRKIKSNYSAKQLWNILGRNDKKKIVLSEISEASRSGPEMAIYYSMLKEKAARDWLSGIKIDGSILGYNSSLEVHHIFPQSVLYKKGWNADWINAFGNYALLRKESNLQIGNSLPSEYLGLGTKFKVQCIPFDKKLWNVDLFEKFLLSRERFLQLEINKFLNL